jgi:hypothetical protein
VIDGGEVREGSRPRDPSFPEPKIDPIKRNGAMELWVSKSRDLYPEREPPKVRCNSYPATARQKRNKDTPQSSKKIVIVSESNSAGLAYLHVLVSSLSVPES